MRVTVFGHSSARMASSSCSAVLVPWAVITFFTGFQGRTFGAPVLTTPTVNSEDGTRVIEGERAAKVTRRKRLGFNRGLAVAGRQLSPRPSDGSPTSRRLPRTAAR